MHSEIRIVNGCLELRRYCTTQSVANCSSVMVRERLYRGIKIKYLGNPSVELRAIILGNLFTLPERDADRLAKFGTTVAVLGWIRDLDANLALQCPRGWEPSKTWNDADGIYQSSSKTAAISEFTSAGKSPRSASILWHELGHAIDHALGWYSHSDALKQAYDEDVNRLDDDLRKKHAYFLQDGVAGREEVFAEIYGALNTSRPGEIHKILEAFPEALLQLLFRLQQPE